MFKKENKKDQEVRGGEGPRNETYAIHTWVTEKQANEDIRCVIFIGLFEQPLKDNRISF